MLKIITVCSDLSHTDVLTNTATKNGWDLVKIKCEWRGFGTKLIETYKYLKDNPEVTEFVFCDAYDVVVMGTPEEFLSKLGVKKDRIYCSAEKGLWPPILIPFRKEYRICCDFKYINSGLYYAPSKLFIEYFEKYPPFNEIDDQLWFNLCWLLLPKTIFASAIGIDFKQSVFNSHSFIAENEYTYENNRVQILGNQPIFIHFNGRSVDAKFNELIKL